MKRRRERRKAIRRNVTAHVRAVADSTVAAMIKDLRQRWRSLDRVERGERLRKLTSLGCSTRGLERALRQSATSIRRHIDLANLPTRYKKS